MRYRWTGYLGVILCGIWGSCASLAWGQSTVLVDFSTTQKTVPKGWELSVHASESDLQLVQDDGKQASFSLQKKIQISLQASPFLVWDWKVTALPKGGDFRRSGSDDQAAQLIIAFSSSRFLSYIWDSTAPKGLIASAPAPVFKKVFAVVMQSGTQGLGTWITERRNLIDDYKQAYGEAPEVIEGVRIQINSQHTQSRAESYWHSIAVMARP